MGVSRIISKVWFGRAKGIYERFVKKNLGKNVPKPQDKNFEDLLGKFLKASLEKLTVQISEEIVGRFSKGILEEFPGFINILRYVRRKLEKFLELALEDFVKESLEKKIIIFQRAFLKIHWRKFSNESQRVF